MNNKITNEYLKRLITEIGNKTAEGRITGISWNVLEEARKKKKSVKKEVKGKKETDPIDALLAGGENPEAGAGERGAASDQTPTAQKQSPEANVASPEDKKEAPTTADAEVPSPEAGDEDPEKVKADAAKKKAELEKAKAEKDQAEKELEKQSYVRLKSSGGLQFMLNKIVGQAFKSNTIDALASEMAQKLKITTPEDAVAFDKEMALYKNVPGMVDLLSSIKSIAVEKPETSKEENPAE